MSEPFVGQIALFGFNFAPVNWASCMGQLLPISQYTVLFSLIGTYYGGNGTTNFALPDLRGCTTVGMGTQLGGETYNLGEIGGAETVTLTQAAMPLHSHSLNATTTLGTTNTPGSTTVLAQPAAGQPAHRAKGEIYSTGTVDSKLASSSIIPSGGGASHNNVQPSLALNYCIAVQGIFPSRQ